MKTLKCKNCGKGIKWTNVDRERREMALARGELSFTIGCPSCRQNTVYRYEEFPQYIVDEPANDTVHEPPHYNQGKIKVADYAEQVVAHYRPVEAPHIYNAIKYISRAPHKGTKDADIDKAINSLIRAKTGEWKE